MNTIEKKALDYAIKHLTQEIESLEFHLKTKHYIPLQREILEEKLSKMKNELKEFDDFSNLETVSAIDDPIVPTPFGDLVVTKSKDPSYPGLAIEIQKEDGLDCIVVVEHYVEDNIIKVHNYKENTDEVISSIHWK